MFGYMVILGPNIASTSLWMSVDSPSLRVFLFPFCVFIDLVLSKFFFRFLEGNEIAYNSGIHWFKHSVERTRTAWVLGGSLIVFGFFMFFALRCVTKL